MILSSSKFHHHLHFRGCWHQQRARCMVHDPQSTVSERCRACSFMFISCLLLSLPPSLSLTCRGNHIETRKMKRGELIKTKTLNRNEALDAVIDSQIERN